MRTVCCCTGRLHTRVGVDTWQYVCRGWHPGDGCRFQGGDSTQHTCAVLWHHLLPWRLLRLCTAISQWHVWRSPGHATPVARAWAQNNWEPWAGDEVAASTDRLVDSHVRRWPWGCDNPCHWGCVPAEQSGVLLEPHSGRHSCEYADESTDSKQTVIGLCTNQFKTRGQRNLTKGCPFLPPNCPFPWGSRPPCNTQLRRPTCQMASQLVSLLLQASPVSRTDIQTLSQKGVAIGRMYKLHAVHIPCGLQSDCCNMLYYTVSKQLQAKSYEEEINSEVI